MQARREIRRQNFQQRPRMRNLVLYSMEETGDSTISDGTRSMLEQREMCSDSRDTTRRRGETTFGAQNNAPNTIDSSCAWKESFVSPPKSDANNAPQSLRDDSHRDAENGTSIPPNDDASGSFDDFDSLNDPPYQERKHDDTHYAIETDPEQYDRAVEIPLFSSARPHMRAFHFAWASFFVAFFAWFAMTPLLTEIQYSLSLTKQEIWISSILAVVASALTRIVAGPLNDKYGARWIMSMTLILTAIPIGLSGWLIQNASSLYWTRFMIGVAGSSFVTCQSWISSMFAVEIAGTAQALAAGWANLAGGLSQVVMGSLLFPLFKIIYGGEGYSRASAVSISEHESDSNDRSAELAWRTILAFPALLCLVMAYVVVRYSDDSPRGNVAILNREGTLQRVSAVDSLQRAASSWNTWVLAAQYGCCFGVEIAITQAASLYFKEQFNQTTESAAAIASAFGWMNVFARAVGGFASDVANARFGMRGRLWTQVVFFLIEGSLVIAFSHTRTLVGAIFVLILLSIFVSAAAGSTFAIVPYVDYSVTGSISGLVGAGGSVFGIFYLILFLKFDYRETFLWMGCSVLGGALLTVFLAIRGYRGLLTGEDSPEVQQQRRMAELPEEITISRDQ